MPRGRRRNAAAHSPNSGGGGFMRRILYTREKSFAGKAAHMRRIEALAAMAACACLCAALSGCAVKEPAAQEEADPAPQAAVQPTPDFKESASGDPRLREGKEEVTVLVLNASSAEGAARKAAEKIEALGFEHVTTGNASYYQTGNRVSYHHEDEVAALFDSLPPYDPYCYEDAKSGGWSMDYDILVMVG